MLISCHDHVVGILQSSPSHPQFRESWDNVRERKKVEREPFLFFIFFFTDLLLHEHESVVGRPCKWVHYLSSPRTQPPNFGCRDRVCERKHKLRENPILLTSSLLHESWPSNQIRSPTFYVLWNHENLMTRGSNRDPDLGFLYSWWFVHIMYVVEIYTAPTILCDSRSSPSNSKLRSRGVLNLEATFSVLTSAFSGIFGIVQFLRRIHTLQTSGVEAGRLWSRVEIPSNPERFR